MVANKDYCQRLHLNQFMILCLNGIGKHLSLTLVVPVPIEVPVITSVHSGNVIIISYGSIKSNRTDKEVLSHLP